MTDDELKLMRIGKIEEVVVSEDGKSISAGVRLEPVGPDIVIDKSRDAPAMKQDEAGLDMITWRAREILTRQGLQRELDIANARIADYVPAETMHEPAAPHGVIETPVEPDPECIVVLAKVLCEMRGIKMPAHPDVFEGMLIEARGMMAGLEKYGYAIGSTK